MKRNHAHTLRTWILLLWMTMGAHGAVKVAVAPIQGTSTYPVLLDGVRQIILSDLNQTQEFQGVSTGAELRDFSTEKYASYQSVADVVVSLTARDQLNRLEVSVRAMDTSTGYNLGSQKVSGGFQNIRLLQDKISSAVMSILRVTVSPAKQSEIFKNHLGDSAELQVLGEAGALVDKKQYLPALRLLSAAQKNFSSKSIQGALERAAKSLLETSKASDDRGYAQFYLGNPSEAIREFEAALQANPSNQKALIGKAEVLASIGKSVDATDLLQKAQRRDPNSAAISQALGNLYMAEGSKNSALEQFQRASALGSGDPTLYENLGQVLAQKKQVVSAAQAYSKAADLSKAAVNFRQARDLYAKSQQLSPSVDAGLKEVEVLLKMGETDAAINVLNRLSVARPDSDLIRARLGYAFFLQAQTDAAIRRFREALEINPRNYEANFYLGVIYDDFVLEDTLAIRYLEAATKIRSEEIEPVTRLAAIYVEQKKSAAAIQLLERLVKVAPGNADLHLRLGEAYFSAENYASAELSFGKAAQMYPDLLAAHEGLARTYVQTGQVEKALASLDRVFAIDAADNVFIREGENLLLKLTSKSWIDLVRRFPKVVGDLRNRDVAVNQVTLMKLAPENSIGQWLRDHFSLFTVDEKRLAQDLELAMFARYRVVHPEAMKAKVLTYTQLQDAGNMNLMAESLKVDGIFAYQVTAFSRGGDGDHLKVDLLFHTAADSGLHGIEDKASLESANYPRDKMIVLNPKAPLSYLAVILFVLLPILYFTVIRARQRGWGRVRIIVNYDPKMESFLTLKLSTTVEDVKSEQQLIVRDKDKYQKSKYKKLVQQRGAWVKQMVGHETVFERVPARSYYCYLYGTIEDSEIIKKTVGNYSMMQQFTLAKNETKELVFELEKKEAYVLVYVIDGDRYLSGSEIISSASQEVKFARGEAGTFFYFPLGEHVLTVRHEGKTYRQKVQIRDLQDKSVLFDVQNVDELLADEEVPEEKIVHAAKNMETQGRTEEAAKLLEKVGKTEDALDVRAQQLLSEGDSLKAAQEYARGRDFLKAAKIYEQMGDHHRSQVMYGFHHLAEKQYEKAISFLEKTDSYQALASAYRALDREDAYHSTMAKHQLSKGQNVEAAQSFIKAKEYSRAAEMYESLKELDKAAILYAKDGNFSLSANLFAQIGDTLKAAKAFEQGGFYDDAISLYRELDQKDKIITLLVQAERFTEAAREAKDQGLTDEAIQICQKTPENHLEYFDSQVLLAQLFFERGMKDLSLQTFQHIMKEHSERMDDEALYVYAELLESLDQPEGALAVFENILKRNFHFKDVNLRVTDLKSKVETIKKVSSQTSRETIGGMDPQKPARYEIIDELGRGAMGIVYKAKDRMLDRLVAYKTLPHTLKNDEEALQSLRHEAQTAAKLNHPNIVTVFDVGEENGTYFIAMEYIEGKTLQDILKQYRKVTGANFLHIARSLCSVLAYAHEQKVIHRDVKPSNIILTPNKNVKLMDFGLAKILEDLAIDKTMLRGTPLYMAPEQVLGKDIDHRCDIYALGVIFYEMLSKNPPFTDGDIMYAHLHIEPKSLAEVAPEVPPHIVAAVMMCLQKKKTDRPENAKALWQMLSQGA